jgi:pimeloyl-ACP methyl ester carboxylesterase
MPPELCLLSRSVIAPYLTLLKWLGPWSPQTARANARVVQRSRTIEGPRPFEAWVLAPKGKPPTGALLVCPGLHYQGPADPRMARFIEVLASSGILVLAPFLPDFLDLRVEASVVEDLDRAFGALLEEEALPRGIKPGIFSVSFGSLPTLRLAASEKRRDQVGAVIVFGGYAEFANAIRFAIGVGADGTKVNAKRDPLNQPVVLMNLIEHLAVPDSARRIVLETWRRYVTSTWGRPELKAPERWRPIAEELAREVPAEARELFRIGCGLEDGAMSICEAALEKQAERRAFLDPRPHLGGVRCPVYLCHGADDDVIPHTELELLAAAMPAHVRVRRYLTGLYHHTGANPVLSLPLMLKEGVTLLGLMRALVRGSRMPA